MLNLLFRLCFLWWVDKMVGCVWWDLSDVRLGMCDVCGYEIDKVVVIF